MAEGGGSNATNATAHGCRNMPQSAAIVGLVAGALSLLGCAFLMLAFAAGVQWIRGMPRNRKAIFWIIAIMSVFDLIYVAKWMTAASWALQDHCPSLHTCAFFAAAGHFSAMGSASCNACLIFNLMMMLSRTLKAHDASHYLHKYVAWICFATCSTTVILAAAGQLGEAGDGACWVKGGGRNPYSWLFFAPLFVYLGMAVAVVVQFFMAAEALGLSRPRSTSAAAASAQPPILRLGSSLIGPRRAELLHIARPILELTCVFFLTWVVQTSLWLCEAAQPHSLPPYTAPHGLLILDAFTNNFVGFLNAVIWRRAAFHRFNDAVAAGGGVTFGGSSPWGRGEGASGPAQPASQEQQQHPTVVCDDDRNDSWAELEPLAEMGMTPRGPRTPRTPAMQAGQRTVKTLVEQSTVPKSPGLALELSPRSRTSNDGINAGSTETFDNPLAASATS